MCFAAVASLACSSAGVQVHVDVECGSKDGIAELRVASLEVIIEEVVVEEFLVFLEPLHPFPAVSEALLDFGFRLRAARAQSRFQNLKRWWDNEDNDAAQRGVLPQVLGAHDVEVHEAHTILIEHFSDRGFRCTVPRVMDYRVLQKLSLGDQVLEHLWVHEVVALTVNLTIANGACGVADTIPE